MIKHPPKKITAKNDQLPNPCAKLPKTSINQKNVPPSEARLRKQKQDSKQKPEDLESFREQLPEEIAEQILNYQTQVQRSQNIMQLKRRNLQVMRKETRK